MLFYAGFGMVLVAVGTEFGRRHRVIGQLGVACALLACLGGVITVLVLER